MGLFKKTLQSFHKREKIILFFLTLIFVYSFTNIFILQKNDADNTAKGTKVYTEGLVGQIRWLNPLLADFSEADKDISHLIFSGLVRYDSGTGTFQEDIATHTLSEDKMTYTFTLKNEILWHDGVELSSDDLMFTFGLIQSEGFMNPVLKANFDGVKIEKIDARTLTFTLNKPNSFFFTNLNVGILPKHILGEIDVSELSTHGFNQMPIGTGPYKVNAPYVFESDESMSVSLSVNENYYGDLPEIETLRFVAYPSVTDLVENRAVWNGAARIRQSQFKELSVEDLQVYKYELPQYTALFFNTDSSFLIKNNMRLGISKAIDKDAILAKIDYTVRIDTPLLELDQNEWLHKSDLDESQGAFFDAGWTLNEETGVRENEDGEPLVLRMARRDFTNDNPLQEEILSISAATVLEQLQEVGVELKIESYGEDELTDVIRERDYDILLYGQSLGYNLDIFSYWHSSQAGENGLNLSNYQNPKADFYMESVRENFVPEEREALLLSLAQIIAEDVPAVFLYTPSYYYLQDPRITGLHFAKLLTHVDRLSGIAQWRWN